MLRAYLDESNSNLQGKVCVVAGFIGSDEQWNAFIEEWIKNLGPQRTSLHMKNLRWKENDRKLLGRLGALPDKHGLYRVGAVVRNDDYNAIVKGKIRDRYANPYMLAVQMCVAQLLKCVKPAEPVALYFEEQAVYKWRVSELSESVLRLNPGREISVSILKRDDSPAFQAADYLSYAISHLREKRHGLRTRWCSPILGNGEIIGVEASSEMIQFYVEKCIAGGMGISERAVSSSEP